MSIVLDDVVVNMSSSMFRYYADNNTYNMTYNNSNTQTGRGVTINEINIDDIISSSVSQSKPSDKFEFTSNNDSLTTLGDKINKPAEDKRMSITVNANIIESLVERNLRNIWVSDENILKFYENPVSLLDIAFNLSRFSALIKKYNCYELNEKILLDISQDVDNLNLSDVHNLYTHNTREFDNVIISPKFDLRKKGSKEKRAAFYRKYKERFIIDIDTMEIIKAYILESIKYINMITDSNYKSNVIYTANYTNYISLSVSLDYVTDKYMFKTIFLSDLSDAGIELYLSKNRTHDIIPLVELVANLAQTQECVNKDDRVNYAEKELIILAVDINNSRRIRPYKLNSKMLVESRSSFAKNLSMLNKIIHEVDTPPIDYIFA